MNTAIIKITPELKEVGECMDVQTNGLTNLDMVEHLNVLVKHFAQRIISEAMDMGCGEGEDLEYYIKFLRKNKL